MNIRFYNARILTLVNGFDIIEGELWVEGNRITYVGEKANDVMISAKNGVWDREIDVSRNLFNAWI